MMSDFYSGHAKHANPTSRLVKQKDNAWESKHTMRKSMAHKAHEIEYVVDPSRADVMQPSKPTNYNLGLSTKSRSKSRCASLSPLLNSNKYLLNWFRIENTSPPSKFPLPWCVPTIPGAF